MSDVGETLAARDAEYGSYPRQAAINQAIKKAMRASTNWHDLKDEQRDALEMIAVKVSRILNGSPDYIDSWLDIAGYATLVVRGLRGNGIQKS